MNKLPLVIPYLKTPDHGKELRYALRSLKNLTDWDGKNIVVVGDRESWFNNILVIPYKKRSYSPYENVENKILAVIDDYRIPDTFILSMDDIYITRKTSLKPLYRGELPKDGKGYHMRAKVATRCFLEDRGIKTPLDYEVHAPMIMNKQKRIEVHNLIKGSFRGIALQSRSIYGNIFNIGGIYYEDQKTKTSELKLGTYLSTQYYTDELSKLFPKPSEFEALA